MTENLRKEFTAGEVLKPETTDVATNTTVGLTTQPYNQPGGDNHYDWGVADDTSTNYNRSTVDRWLSRSTKVGTTWSTETNPSNQTDSSKKQNLTGEDQKLGVYYNWYTATTGTGNWDISTGDVTATSSICPKGWQLPRYSAVTDSSTIAPNGSLKYLIRDIYGIIIGTSQDAPLRTHAFPLSLPFSGNINWQSGVIGNQGALGFWWAAGSTSQTNARNLRISSTGVWPEDGYYRLGGFTVRCVMK